MDAHSDSDLSNPDQTLADLGALDENQPLDPDPGLAETDATLMDLDQTMMDEDGTLMDLDQTMMDADATVMDLDQTVLDTDATAVGQEGSLTGRLMSEIDARYNTMGTLGEGAMGQVLLAKDAYLRRQVALKQIHRHIASKRQILGRFLNEAQITAQLDHPSIIPVYSLDVLDDGSIAYSMKKVEGKTLKELIQESRALYKNNRPIDEEHATPTLLSHFLKVCDAMSFAHSKEIIHRDLKPANIMVGPFNEVYVMDWGIARLMRGKEVPLDDELAQLIQPDQHEPPVERTQIGQILGTPRYMSPQQAAGKNDELDGASDQFSLGLILFELLTLQPAFKGSNPVEMIKTLLTAKKEPMVHISPQIKISPEIQAIVNKATAKKVTDRYASVDDFADDIRRYLRGEETHARPDNPLQKLLRWMRHHPQTTLVMALIIMLVSASTILGSLYMKQRSIAAAQVREQVLSQFLTTVAQKSQQINSAFLEYEVLLEGMATAATEALSLGPSRSAPIFTAADFDRKSVPTQADSKMYRKPISLTWPVVKLAPQIALDQVKPELERLMPLRTSFQNAFWRSNGQTGPLDLKQLKTEIEAGQIPLVWTYIGLESGAMFSYPGKGGYAPEYDPRRRPWYTQSKGQAGNIWSAPYLDAQGQGLIVACTHALYDYENRFMGVMGLELTLRYIQEQMLNLKPEKGIKGIYLLNAEGKILAEQGQTIHTTSEALQTYSQPEIIAEIKAQKSGYLENLKQGTLTAYYRLKTLGWYYIVEIKTNPFFKVAKP